MPQPHNSALPRKRHTTPIVSASFCTQPSPSQFKSLHPPPECEKAPGTPPDTPTKVAATFKSTSTPTSTSTSAVAIAVTLAVAFAVASEVERGFSPASNRLRKAATALPKARVKPAGRND
jgi:hypothetical protein